MNARKDNMNSIPVFKLLAFLTVTVLLFTSVRLVHSQTTETDWSLPVNVSRSGGASDPRLVVDASGTAHLLWLDQYSGFTYARGKDGEWETPIAARYPFVPAKDAQTNQLIGRTPLLLAGPNNFIHALWIDPTKKTLNYSGALASNFGLASAWLPFRQLSHAALNMDWAMDADGNIAMAYIKSVENELAVPGLFFSRYIAGGSYWTSPQLLFESPYFRTLSPEMANVHVATRLIDGQSQIFVVWDNRPRNSVYFSRSIDGGKTWSEPLTIDGPELSAAAVSPANIRVGVNQNEVILLWQSAQPGQSCTEYYQVSRDGGESWEDRVAMPANLQGCPEDNRFLVKQDGTILLVTKVLNQVYLQAWNGTRWSDLQPQNSLTVFTDTESYNVVNLGCHQLQIVGEDTLAAAGCDTGLGGDIWFTSRKIGSSESWFTNKTGWNSPISITSGVNIQLADELVFDENSVHLFWNQSSELDQNLTSIINYSRWDGQNWTAPLALFPSIFQDPGSPVAVVTHDEQIVVLVSDQNSGKIYITTAPVNLANSEAEWTLPTEIPEVANAGMTPAVEIGSDGVLYVVYAMPINENRGIYIIKSEDGGMSWSSPSLVFDASMHDWAMVDRPHLEITADNQLHVLFSRYSTSRGDGTVGLYYVRSSDGGQSWSEVIEAFRGNVNWRKLIRVDNQQIHLITEQGSSQGSTFWHTFTTDGGYNWFEGGTFNSETNIPGQTDAVIINQAVHLMQLRRSGEQGLRLQDWQWNGEQWGLTSTSDLTTQSRIEIGDVLTSTFGNNNLGVVYVLRPAPGSQTQTKDRIFFIERGLAGDEIAEPEEGVEGSGEERTPTQTIPPQPTATATESAGLVGTGNSSGSVNVGAPNISTTGIRSASTWIGLFIGVGLSLMIVIGLVILRNRSREIRRR